MKILVFDNYDSFTYNLVHIIKELGYKDIAVHRNDQISLDDVEQFDKIILSPGPGIPSEASLLLPLIRRYAPTKSILGVCLGHQAIAEAFGGQLINLENVYHGVATPVNIIAEDKIFAGLPKQIEVGRYHSWIVSEENFPKELEITAEDGAGRIMAMKHSTLDIHGVQFHPESVLTPSGTEMIKNFLKNTSKSDGMTKRNTVDTSSGDGTPNRNTVNASSSDGTSNRNKVNAPSSDGTSKRNTVNTSSSDGTLNRNRVNASSSDGTSNRNTVGASCKIGKL